MSRAFGVVLLISGLLKVLLAFVFADLTPHYDEVEFLEFGRRVAAGEAPVLWRAPGYQSFVALGLSVAGGRVVGVRLLQVLLSIATTWFVYRLGRRLGGERVGLAAGAFLAFYPSHVAFSHLLWAETLFLFLTVAAFDRLLVFRESAGWRDAVTVGLLLGAASLVRSMGVAFLLVSVGWLLFTVRRRTRVAVLAAAAVLVIAPWSIHASSRAGRFVLVDTNPGWNLWSGHNEYIEGDLQGIWGTGLSLDNGLKEAWAPHLRQSGIPLSFAGARLDGEWRGALVRRLAEEGIPGRSGPAADAWYRADALREIRQNPTGALGRIPKKLAALWSPDFFLPRHLVRDWYGATSPALAAGLVFLTWVAALVPLVLGPVALTSLRGGSFQALAGLWVLVTLGVHAALFGVSRMHQPLVPFLVLAVSVAWFGEPGARWRRGWIAGAAAILLMITSLPVVVGAYLMPGPRHAGLARTLAAVRHLPVAGTRHTAWMLAEIEAANGNFERAAHILAEPRHADDPGSWFVGVLATPDPAPREALLQKGLAVRPDSEHFRALDRAVAPEGDRPPPTGLTVPGGVTPPDVVGSPGVATPPAEVTSPDGDGQS